MNAISTLPHRQVRRLWMALMLITVIMLAVFPSTATAQEEGYAYYWSLTFDFANGANGQLYVAVGYDEDGDVQEPPIYAQTYSVPCTRVGNATVSGGTLKLNGGYLACDLDVQRAVNATFAASAAIVKGCHVHVEDVDLYAAFQAEAIVSSTVPGNAPIFHHGDASYTINPQSSSTQITASLSPHGVIPSAALPAFPILSTWHTYTALYACGALCQMEYSTAGGVQMVNTAPAKVEFYTPASTIYIGHNPTLPLTAPAGTEIDYLFVDPPNHGND
ncbi:MAG: hypothetical protein KF893_16570 [Caldilineaceae bacterium]|nr:hypothetical protein [Caldilineaceae bacterium]